MRTGGGTGLFAGADHDETGDQPGARRRQWLPSRLYDPAHSAACDGDDQPAASGTARTNAIYAECACAADQPGFWPATDRQLPGSDRDARSASTAAAGFTTTACGPEARSSSCRANKVRRPCGEHVAR